MCRSEPELSLNRPEAVCAALTLIDNGKTLVSGITLIFHEAVLSIYGTSGVKRKEKLRCVKMKESLWGFLLCGGLPGSIAGVRVENRRTER